MKHNIKGYKKNEIIDHYNSVDDGINVTYLDGSTDLKVEENEVENEIHKQAESFVKAKGSRDITLLTGIFSFAILGICVINYMGETLVALLRSVFINPSYLFSTIGFGGLAYVFVMLAKTVTFLLGSYVDKCNDQDKYELYLKNEDKIKNYEKAIELNAKTNTKNDDLCEEYQQHALPFTGRINDIDKATLEQLKHYLIQVYNYDNFNTEDMGYSRVKK
jgi:hypothetical protein